MGTGGAGGAGAGGAEEKGAKMFEGPRALALQVPGKVIMGSSGFQQFFLIYAKLMAGLRDSKVNESGTAPLAMHRGVMRAGKPSQEELDWANCDICPEMNEPTPMSIFVTNP